jgi:hypothetical protein
VLDTVAHVIVEDLFLQSPQRGANRRDLRNDVDAITVVLDHARDPAHLSLDPIQSLGASHLDVTSHAPYIPLRGIGFNANLREVRSWPTNNLHRANRAPA